MWDGSGKGLLNLISVDPGGWSGCQSIVVPTVDGRLRYPYLDALDKARGLGWTHGVEVTDDRWTEHATVLVKAVQHQRRWVSGKVSEIGYDGYRQVLIVEGYDDRAGAFKGDVLSPVKIASVMYWLLNDVVEELRMPLPAEKGQITDDRLRLWKWYVPGKPHLNDARRHMMVYLRSLDVSSP